MTPRLIASTALITPATPAAASRWPMLVLTEPISRGRSGSPPAAVCGAGRLRFDRIADLGTGPVRLDVVYIGGPKPGLPQRGLDDLLLCGAARHGQSGAGAVLVQRGAANHRPDAVAVGFGFGEALEHHDAATLAAHVAVRGRIEGGAAPVRR